MASLTFGDNGLLEYNQIHKILICRKCQYAIQKNAVDSHLLRHKIYRGERQSLLSSIGQLDLVEPENVPLPAPDSLPISALPVLSGFCCTATGCLHLTASSKRMRRHWSESHGLDGAVAISPALARPVKLQTFFRGTKVRYFEVAASSAISVVDETKEDDNSNEEDNEIPEREQQNEQSLPAPSAGQQLTGSGPSNTGGHLALADFSLEILFYFHHFTTTTALTLPSPVLPQYARNYWMMQRVPEALQWHWLMCGTLAVSALHLASLAQDPTVRQIHEQQKEELLFRFNVGLERVRAGAYISSHVEVEISVRQSAEQLNALLECARWVLPVMTFVGPLGVSSQLHFVMTIIRGCEAAQRVDHYANTGFHDPRNQIHHQMFVPDAMYGRSVDSMPEVQPPANTPSSIFDRLQMLPSRIAERLNKPAESDDVLAILAATRLMLRACEVSYSSNEVHIVWQGVATWLKELPAHFDHMVVQHHPAALVLLAHWAKILVKRAADRGCWFLRGLEDEVMLQSLKFFANHYAAAMDLVVDLANAMQREI